MIKPLFFGVAVFLFVLKGAKKGQTICKVCLRNPQIFNKGISIEINQRLLFYLNYNL